MLQRLSAIVAAALVITGCTSSGSPPTAPSHPRTPSPTVSPKARHRHHVTRTPPTRPSPSPVAFHWHTAPVTAHALGASWHPGCPVGPDGLRAISLTYWGFDGRAHEGVLVGATTAVPAYVTAFRTMYDARFPIRRLRPVAAYGGSDNRSMAHDNTSAFNCRYAVANGPKQWSMHAYGLAVDVDPRENPYLLDGKVLPPQGKPFVDRSRMRAGMVVAGSVPVRAFTAVGWGWGGVWSSPDYQHFSSTGQ